MNKESTSFSLSSLSTSLVQENSPASSLSPSHPLYLVDYFMEEGKKFLAEDNLSAAILCFDQALKIESTPSLLYLQAKLLYKHGLKQEKNSALLLAIRRFKRYNKEASKEEPKALFFMGKCSLTLGERLLRQDFLLQAEAWLQQATLCTAEKDKDYLASLFYALARTWLLLSHFSQEAWDVQKSLHYFSLASQKLAQPSYYFWNDLGKAYKKMGDLTSDIRYYIQACSTFKKSLTITIDRPTAWEELHQVLCTLYFHSHKEDYFLAAEECATASIQLCIASPSLLSSHINLLLYYAYLKQHLKAANRALCLSQELAAKNPENLSFAVMHQEASALLGNITGNLEQLIQAENSIKNIITREPEPSSLLLSHAKALRYLGIYFQDLDYFYQAIEKIQAILSSNRKQPLAWLYMGDLYLHIARETEDENDYFRSLYFYEKSLQLSSTFSLKETLAKVLLEIGEKKNDKMLLERAFDMFSSLLKEEVGTASSLVFSYAKTLCLLGDFQEDENYYFKALELLQPLFYKETDSFFSCYWIAIAYSRIAQIQQDPEKASLALYYFQLAYQRSEEKEASVLLEWGLMLIHLAEMLTDNPSLSSEHLSTLLYKEAESKLKQAALLGNEEVFYHLACLYSLLNEHSQALYFLKKSHLSQTLPSQEELSKDEWLESFISTAYFQEFIDWIEIRP